MQQKIDREIQPIQFSVWKLPNSMAMRSILLLLFFAMLICGSLLNEYSGMIIFASLLLLVLWGINRFEYQQQQLQQLQHRLSVLEQQLSAQQLSSNQFQPHDIVEMPSLAAQQSSLAETAEDSVIQQSLEDLNVAQAVVQFPPIPPQQSTPPLNSSPVQTEDYQVMTSLWRAGLDWFKGGNSIVRIAVVILLIGVVLLLRFASEYWQLALSAKMAGISLVGAAITGLGYYLRHKRFDYAISLQGLGFGILFLVLFSSYHLGVISSVVIAYVALAALLATTLLLALKQNALILAFIALGSGFVAPFLLNTKSNDIAGLMAYFFVLNMALAVIAFFKPWRILNSVALILTFGIGGLAIWQSAEPEQYTQISIWVWVIFALYLFMSIRYSQHIAAVHQQLKNIPLVDSTLIFGTPFMAFSLYAGLVDSKGYSLSIASAVLAAVYLSIGYFIHKKFNQLSILSQCFYGLGFVFLALILPFAFDAYWSSVGWAIHGGAMLYLAWRYHLVGAKYFAAVLLVVSGIASVIAGFVDEKSLLFAASVLMVVYAGAYYLFRAPSTQPKEEGEQQLDELLSSFFLLFSFLALTYVYVEGLERLNLPHQDLSLAFLAWFSILSAVWWWRDKQWSGHWRAMSYIVLLLTALLSLLDQAVLRHGLALMQLETSLKIEFLLTAVVWCVVFVGCYQGLYRTVQHQALKTIHQIFTATALIFLGLMGTLWANEASVFYLSALLPVLLLGLSLKLTALLEWQKLWITNLAVIAVGLSWLIWVSFAALGTWALPYFAVLNPVDLLSSAVFVLLAYAIKPYLYSVVRGTQLLSAGTLLVAGLLLVSSILLRMLHHYLALPYWSISAWENSTVQMSLTILWSVIALVLTLLASKKAWRYIWMLGIAVLAVVIAKLIFLDLSHSHTITRIISFIGSGVVMLVIGYFAPLPPKALDTNQENPSDTY